ncbi:MAG: alcohol dehydrogenase catalytic domain-containing protein [Rhizobium sp.]|nr:alcohol dehydrogenase catalytic domain-containing protein [Rhizobium sp.]
MRAVPGAMPDKSAVTATFNAAVIRQQTPSQVSSIRWESCDVPAIGPDEVQAQVAATGLNFRDVMWAMGLLPEEAQEDGFAGTSIGMEFSGRVVALGKNVRDLSIGDPVIAIAAATFATHVAVDGAGVAKLPAGIDPVAAASIPVVFLTAYYAIFELAQARAGETILIHGAAGGVGLAALQVAKHAGLKAIATAGTQEKRRFVEMLGAAGITDILYYADQLPYHCVEREIGQRFGQRSSAVLCRGAAVSERLLDQDQLAYARLSDMLEEVIGSFAAHAPGESVLVVKQHLLDKG